MKYLIAAVLLISTAFAYPVGENEGKEEGTVPLAVSDYAPAAKSEDSEAISHEHHGEVHADVGSPKVEHDSAESSEESGSAESGEKAQEHAKADHESKEKSLQDEKVAQPSEIINSEVVHKVSEPVQDAVKEEPSAGVPEFVPQADPIAPIQSPEVVAPSEIEKVSDPIPAVPTLVQHSESVKQSDPIEESKPIQKEAEKQSEEPQPKQDDVKQSDAKPEIVSESEGPSSKTIPDVVDSQPDVKQDSPVVQSDPVEVVQPKSDDAPEIKEEKKSSDEVKSIEPPVAEIEKALDKVDSKKEAIPSDELVVPSAPVQDEIVKPVEEVAADAIQVPQSKTAQAKDDAPKIEVESEASPAKLPEPSPSS